MLMAKKIFFLERQNQLIVELVNQTFGFFVRHFYKVLSEYYSGIKQFQTIFKYLR